MTTALALQAPPRPQTATGGWPRQGAARTQHPTAPPLPPGPPVVHRPAGPLDEPRRIAELFAENARRFLEGEPLLTVVNTHAFY